MLTEIYIENVAIIEKAHIDFNEGLNVLTGETGAGKSILINSISAILGDRVTKDIVRTGEKKANVMAVFSPVSKKIFDFLDAMGYSIGKDDNLIITREISAEGGTVCRINGKPASVSNLRDLGLLLINIHGQHNTQDLMSKEKHIAFIDDYGNLSNLLSKYQEEYKKLRTLEKKISKIKVDEGEKERRLDILAFQIEEIKKADLSEDEEYELALSQKRIHNFTAVNNSLNTAYNAMQGDELGETQGALELLEVSVRNLENVVKLADDHEDIYKKISEVYYELEDISLEISRLILDGNFDVSDLDNIEHRLDEIHRLKRKYGNSIEEILMFLDGCEIELLELESIEENTEKLTSEIIMQKNICGNLAKKLSDERKKYGNEFCINVKKELKYLDMPDVDISAEIILTDLTSQGIDDLELLIKTNKGEDFKPLAKIASGGELSRIMLGIKNILADKDNIDVMIFDEIDAGISGIAAKKVGNKLKEISKGRQVLCVTHQAQIAALADHHLLIFKKIKDNRTFTDVKMLSREQRLQEIAKIIGGDNITDITLKNADEMLKLADN